MNALKITICRRKEPDKGKFIINLNSDGTFIIPRESIKNGSISPRLMIRKKGNVIFSKDGKVKMERAENELEAILAIIDSISPDYMIKDIIKCGCLDNQVLCGSMFREINCPGCGVIQKILRESCHFTCSLCGRQYEKNPQYREIGRAIENAAAEQKMTVNNAESILRKVINGSIFSRLDKEERNLILELLKEFSLIDSPESKWLFNLIKGFISDEKETDQHREYETQNGISESELKIIIPVIPKQKESFSESFYDFNSLGKERTDIHYHKEFIKNQGGVLWDIILPGQISCSPLIEESKSYLEHKWSGLFFYGPRKEISYKFYVDYIKRDSEIDPEEWDRFAPDCRRSYPKKLRDRIYWVKIKDIEEFTSPHKLDEYIKRSDDKPLRTSFLRNFTIVKERSENMAMV